MFNALATLVYSYFVQDALYTSAIEIVSKFGIYGCKAYGILFGKVVSLFLNIQSPEKNYLNLFIKFAAPNNSP
jgi:hypothetical protein